MEQENKFEKIEIIDDINDTKAESEGHEHHSHSHYDSGSHHSSHSHHGRHHSSRHKKHSRNRKKHLLDKIQSWINKKLGIKGIVVFSISVLLVISLLISVIYLVEMNNDNKNSLNDGQDELFSDGTDFDFETPNYSSTVVKIPSYWENMINEKTKTVKALQTAGGMDCVSFVWASDTHIPNNDTARTNDIGKIMAKMLDNCEIPFAVLSGDIGTRASCSTEEEYIKMQEMVPKHLAPLWGTDRLLVALGNHDGCYGDSSGYYKKQYTPERLWQMYFRGQALDSRRVFSEDGTYFYVDNKAQKTRFIILNSQFGGEYSADENGWAVNNRFAVSCYGQEQLDWLANVALNMPKGYGAVIVSHVPPKMLYSTNSEPYTVDCAQLCGIINAYNKKSSFKGSYTAGVNGWSNSTVNVDFSNAKGEIIAMFTGHIHQDSIDTTTLECPLITIISAGASVNYGEAPERKFGTDTETSFDVVTINRKSRTIYLTRVGAGEDRIVKY